MSVLETKHTPKPWATSRDAVPDGHVQITVYAEADGQRVATVFRTPANARLIKAAPDLAEALQRTVGYIMDTADRDDPMPSCVRDARAVLAEAVV